MHEYLKSKLKSNNTIISIFIIIGTIIYINSLGGKLFWDAEYEILQNAYIKDWSYIPRYFSESLGSGAGRGGEYWRPVLLLLYSIEWHIWKGWEVGYHFINISIHITNSILIFYILKRLLKCPLVSFFVSLIFLVHPLQTESVTYITGVADPLATLWMFLSLLFYTKQRKKISLLFFLLSLMTKETSIIFPGILIFTDHILNGWNKSLYKTILGIFTRTWIYFALSTGYLLARVTILNFGSFLNLYGESTAYTQSILIRFYTFLKTIPVYTELLIYPHDLHMERNISWGMSIFDKDVLLGFIIILLIIFAGVYGFKKDPRISLASALYLVPLIPVSGVLIPANALIYEHWLYIPIVGFYLLIGLLLEKIYALIKLKTLYFYTLITTFALFILFLSISTIIRNHTYGDPERFYNNILKYNQTSLRVWNNLGMLYSEKSEWDKSIHAYQTAISLDPKDQSWPPHHNLGNTYKNQGKTELALREFNRSLEINPEAYPTYLALTQLYLDQKDNTRAIDTINRAIIIFPQNLQLRQILTQVERVRHSGE